MNNSPFTRLAGIKCPIACTDQALPTFISTAPIPRPAQPATMCCLYIRPTLQTASGPEPSDAVVNEQFAQIFSACEKDGSPKKWDQLPMAWQTQQKDLLQQYDA